MQKKLVICACLYDIVILETVIRMSESMPYQSEKKILNDYLKHKRLKHSVQREEILTIFLATEEHVTADELVILVRNEYPFIGSATVYRTLKLMCEADLAREVQLGDGKRRFEHNFGHQHHDHLVCLSCGDLIEIYNRKLEKIQDSMVQKHRFSPKYHRLEIFGYCSKCSENNTGH